MSVCQHYSYIDSPPTLEHTDTVLSKRLRNTTSNSTHTPVACRTALHVSSRSLALAPCGWELTSLPSSSRAPQSTCRTLPGATTRTFSLTLAWSGSGTGVIFRPLINCQSCLVHRHHNLGRPCASILGADGAPVGHVRTCLVSLLLL